MLDHHTMASSLYKDEYKLFSVLSSRYKKQYEQLGSDYV